MTVARVSVPFPESGLDNVRLVNVRRWKCRNGHDQLEIPAVDELLERLADAVIGKPAGLNGQEVRFLRKRIGLAAKDFAKLLGITPVHLSRLENGARGLKRPMDLLVRLFYAQTLARQRNRKALPSLACILEQPAALPAEGHEHRLRLRERGGSKNGTAWLE